MEDAKIEFVKWPVSHAFAIYKGVEAHPQFPIPRQEYKAPWLFYTHGMDACLAMEWAPMAVNYPHLRSFLVEFGKRGFDWPDKVYEWNDFIIPPYRPVPSESDRRRAWEKMLSETAKSFEGCRFDEEKEAKRLKSGDLSMLCGIPASMLGKEAIKGWVNGPRSPIMASNTQTYGDGAIAFAMALMCGKSANLREIETLDTYPYWESKENIERYKYGTR